MTFISPVLFVFFVDNDSKLLAIFSIIENANVTKHSQKMRPKAVITRKIIVTSQSN